MCRVVALGELFDVWGKRTIIGVKEHWQRASSGEEGGKAEENWEHERLVGTSMSSSSEKVCLPR